MSLVSPRLAAFRKRIPVAALWAAGWGERQLHGLLAIWGERGRCERNLQTVNKESLSCNGKASAHSRDMQSGGHHSEGPSVQTAPPPQHNGNQSLFAIRSLTQAQVIVCLTLAARE